MLSPEETTLIDRILSIPKSQNPYLTASAYLKDAVATPKLDAWARHLLIACLFAYFIMYLQCFHLIYIRVRTKTFRLFQTTELGLIRLDVPNVSGLVYFLFCPLVIADLILQLEYENGRRDLGGRIALLGCKFLVLLTCSWSFLWVCACQCIHSMWGESASWSRAVQSRRRVRFPPILRWTLNISFVMASLAPVPSMVWSLHRNDLSYERSKEITKNMINALHSAAPSYDPKTYTPVQVLTFLMPATELVGIRDDIAVGFRVAIITALIDLCLLSILYAPLIYATLKVIRKRSRELRFTFATATADKADRIANIKARLEEEHKAIVHHAWSAYITTVSFIPILAWLTSYRDASFVQNKQWNTILQIGLHAPFAISGNVIELILNLQARRMLKLYREREKMCNTCSRKHESRSDSGKVER